MVNRNLRIFSLMILIILYIIPTKMVNSSLKTSSINQDNEDFTRRDMTRTTLLQYSNQKVTEHVGYIISFLLAFISLYRVDMYTCFIKKDKCLNKGIDVLIRTIFCCALIYSVGRMVFWTSFQSDVINIGLNETYETDPKILSTFLHKIMDNFPRASAYKIPLRRFALFFFKPAQNWRNQLFLFLIILGVWFIYKFYPRKQI